MVSYNYYNTAETQNTEEINKKEEVTEPAVERIKSNSNLIISEVLGKVILPYRGEEIQAILDSPGNGYTEAYKVIEDKFTRPLSDYKFQSTARYNETAKLAKKVEHFNSLDTFAISTEMMTKRYLHPAIITACRSLDELDVYLDCLEKGEVNDFKIFNIKYELYPTVVKNNKMDFTTPKRNFIQRIIDKIVRYYKKNTHRGKRYAD